MLHVGAPELFKKMGWVQTILFQERFVRLQFPARNCKTVIIAKPRITNDPSSISLYPVANKRHENIANI